jgi:hypothetical protein
MRRLTASVQRGGVYLQLALTYIPVGKNQYEKTRWGLVAKAIKMHAENSVVSNLPAVGFVVCLGPFRVAPDNTYRGFPVPH